ncbi:MAG: hypothetical protein K5Q00_06065, partial [Gammaproteobacteria bacterium]|nr:hypothetical protein [Gammaproteobacteria bacterium]
SSCDPRATPCTEDEIAQNDLAEWAANLRATLPNGVGTLVGDKNVGFLTTVMWLDKEFVDTNGALQSSAVCTGSPVVITTTCCPAGTPNGVRCVNSAILP